MTSLRIPALAILGVVLAAPPLFAQNLSHYRDFALGDSVASVVKVTAAQAADIRTLHQRPAKIQQIEWRAPYVGLSAAQVDPVRGALFTFLDDRLYRIVISYNHAQMEGLTEDDVIESVSATYAAVPMQTRRANEPPRELPPDTTLIAEWDDGASLLSLVRGVYSRQFQLVLISKQLSTHARTAVTEARRLDVEEAPQREFDLRRKTATEALVSQNKIRAENKAAFRP